MEYLDAHVPEDSRQNNEHNAHYWYYIVWDGGGIADRGRDERNNDQKY